MMNCLKGEVEFPVYLAALPEVETGAASRAAFMSTGAMMKSKSNQSGISASSAW